MKYTFTCLTLLLLAVSCVNTSGQKPAATDSANTIIESISFTDTAAGPEDEEEERLGSDAKYIIPDSATLERKH